MKELTTIQKHNVFEWHYYGVVNENKNKINSHSLMQMVGDVETVRHQYIQRDIG